MTNYHEYHVEVEDEQGNPDTKLLHVHEDHHDAHGFDGSGKLKNTAAMVTIAAGVLGIAEYLVKGFKYAERIIKK